MIHTSSAQRPLPLGIDDFQTLIRQNYYYVDKTDFIAEILQAKAFATLITRPRRFGKTLNMSMLENFFNIEKKEENADLYAGLAIEKSPYYSERGNYPVIFISVKDLKEKTFADLTVAIRNFLSELFKKYEFGENDINPLDRPRLEKIQSGIAEIVELSDALKFLCKLLMTKYQKKVILLIDEYDSPIIHAYAEGYYEDAIGFFRNFYSAAIKSNEYLEMAVLTGILRVAKESIFSGLNNLKICSVLQPFYLKHFGFTETELEQICHHQSGKLNAILKKNNLTEMAGINLIRQWYDGYLFGKGTAKQEVYNPWSILALFDNGNLQSYWINTGSDVLIEQILKNDLSESVEYLEELMNGGTITRMIDENVTLQAFDTRKTIDDLWGLLLYSGYLTLVCEKDFEVYELRIPNFEVKKYFQKLLMRTYSFSGNAINLLELMHNKQEKFVEELQKLFFHSASYYDFRSENSYHMFLLGIFVALANKRFSPISNREAGKGRFDIMLTDSEKEIGYVIELKIASKPEDTQFAALEAIRQIRHNQYAQPLITENYQHITAVGFGFYGKEFRVIFEQLK